ncbi:Glycosyltransferase involved in cell wall bisynthesis [Pseudobutyrivibrio sp. ACV-2]|uniref:glycosyltransferase n=1 Tax=Pseudobutyrivibrio sp. ACV-2 TaxID=1520801 RepID=UPI00089ABFAD|nr:glycosyltransferase [Pseudobutyrivibrio sp. ACV-2]SEB00665.1 Glycosyltransferase involved in cell wall bisynthesis [Pseudobutyrivibrio sp. ACV-2]
MSNPIRVLQITDCIRHGSGVSEVIMNYYRFMNPSEVLFDFMVNEPVEDDLKKWIESRGSKIFVMPSLTIKNTFKYKKELEKFFRNHQGEYQIIHGHTPNAAAYYMPVAKKYGIPVRILHSHNSRGADSSIKRIRNRLMSRVAIANANQRFACSKVASEYLYGDDEAFILNNAINLEAFKFDASVRNAIRNQLSVSDDIILVGHIGRMAEQKNHLFIVDIAEQVIKEDSNVKFLLIGDGPLRNDILQKIKEKKLENYFILPGVVSNPRDYYQAMDVFILPSLYEGLPVVGVEAQAAGLPTLLSTNVTPETLMTDNIAQCSIDNPVNWAAWILGVQGNRKDNCSILEEKGFNIKKQAKILANQYIRFAGEKNND